MGLLGPHHELLLESSAARIQSALFRLLALQGPPPSTEGTLSGSFAFLAGPGTGPSGSEGARTVISMAEAGAEAEGADVCAGGQDCS